MRPVVLHCFVLVIIVIVIVIIIIIIIIMHPFMNYFFNLEHIDHCKAKNKTQ